ncbi:MAG: MarR family transcriptional regulator [Rhizomicrobium sp.]
MAGYYRAATFTSDICLGYQMKRAQNLLRALLETAFANEELNFSQWTVLVRLKEGDAQNSADLARALSYDTGSLTRLIDQLEERKLLVRRKSISDRRVHDLVLTPAGRAMANALTPRVVDIHNRVLADFSRTEVDTFLRMVRKLADGIENAGADTEAEIPRKRAGA